VPNCIKRAETSVVQ